MAFTESQDLIKFFLNPASYPDTTSRVTHYETHISHVFLCDEVVYKVKKPVNFGFVDFSTLRKRHTFCGKEVVLNSRLAPHIYLGVVPVYTSGDAYSFRPLAGGRIAEYAVKMRRIPHDCILYRLIGEGRHLYSMLEEVGRTISLFHGKAAIYRSRTYGGPATIIASTEENFKQIKPFSGLTISAPLYERLVDYTRSFINEHKEQFSVRKKQGFIRDGHGDLHCQHICLADPPIIFDCIEFNEKFRIIDILEDIAFLFMDLEYRGRFDLSSRLFKAYFIDGHNDFDVELLRFYKVYKAVVRGKVESFRARDTGEEVWKRKSIDAARNYFHLADYYMTCFQKPFNPVVFMGLSGSGKSTIARDFSPNSMILISDEIRKKVSGWSREVHSYGGFGEGIYSPELTDRIYSMLLEETLRAAEQGKKVIVDATYLQSNRRKGFYESCIRKGLNPFFVHCFANETVLRERIKRRIEEGKDVSDAHIGILEEQIRRMEEPGELPCYRVLRLNTEDELHNIINALKEFL